MHERGATSELQDVLLPPSIQVKGFARHLRGLNKKFKDTVSAARGCDCLSKACSGYLEYMKKLHQKFPEVELMDVVIDDAKKNSEVQRVKLVGEQGTGSENVGNKTHLQPRARFPSQKEEKRRLPVEAPYVPQFDTNFASPPNQPIQGPSGVFLPPVIQTSNPHQESMKSTAFPSWSSGFQTISPIGKSTQVEGNLQKESNVGFTAGLPRGDTVDPSIEGVRDPSTQGFSFGNQVRSSVETTDLAGLSKRTEITKPEDQRQDEHSYALEASEVEDDLQEPNPDDVIDLLEESDDQIDVGGSDSQNADPTNTGADHSADNAANVPKESPNLHENEEGEVEEAGEIEETGSVLQMSAPSLAIDSKLQTKHSPIVWGSHLSNDQDVENPQASPSSQPADFDATKLFSPIPTSSTSFSFNSQNSFPTPVGIGKGQPVQSLFKFGGPTQDPQSSTIGDAGPSHSPGLDPSRPAFDKAGINLQPSIANRAAPLFAPSFGGNHLGTQFLQGQSPVTSSGLTNHGFPMAATKASTLGQTGDTGEKPARKRRLFNTGDEEGLNHNVEDVENNPKASRSDAYQSSIGYLGNVNPGSNQGVFGAPPVPKPLSLSSQSLQPQATTQSSFGVPGFQMASNGFSGFNSQNQKAGASEAPAPGQIAPSTFAQPSGGNLFGGLSHGKSSSGVFLGSSTAFGQATMGNISSPSNLGNGQLHSKPDGQATGSLFPASTPAFTSSSQGFALPTGNGTGFTLPTAAASEQDDELPKEKPAVEVQDSKMWQVKFQAKCRVRRQLEDEWKQAGSGVISVRIGKEGDYAGKGWIFFTTSSGSALMCSPLHGEMQVLQHKDPKVIVTTINFLEKKTVAIDPKTPTTVENWVPGLAAIRVASGETATALKEAIDSAKG